MEFGVVKTYGICMNCKHHFDVYEVEYSEHHGVRFFTCPECETVNNDQKMAMYNDVDGVDK